jgi:hypothetical protein
MAMAAVFVHSTIATYVLLCVSSALSLRRMRSGAAERHGEVLSGAHRPRRPRLLALGGSMMELRAIGRIQTTYRSLGDRPANVGGAIVATRIELDAEYARGLDGIEAAPHLIVFYWCRRPVGAARRSAGQWQAAWHLREKARATTALAATEPTTWCRLQARRPRRSRRGRPRGVAGQGPT